MVEPLWVKSYPSGVRWDAKIPTMPVQEILHNAVAKWPNLPALEFMGKKTTYAELQELVNRAAKGFQQLGVKPGVHVGIYLPNTPHYFITFFGILQAGGTVVNYSPMDAEKVLEHKAEDSETDILVTLDVNTLYPQMAALLGKTRIRKLVVGNIAEMALHQDAVQAKMQKDNMLSAIPSDDRHISFAQLLANDGCYQPYPMDDPEKCLAVLQYTGGTTGVPKGAMLTHGNLSAACNQAWETVNGDTPVMLEGQERLLAVLPPFHIYALTGNVLFGIRIGAEMILHTRFDPEAVTADLAAKKITGFWAVPTMLSAILNFPGVEKLDLTSMKYCNSGGAPLPVEVLHQFKRLTGCNLAEGWGMTETSPTGTFTPVHGMRKTGSCGLPSPGITFKFLSLSDETTYVPTGERGEICVSGPNVMKGYWKNPAATAAAMTADGFLRTGDVGYMDEDGFVYIVDRTKDMLLCSGFNVYPRIIEEAIYEHPSVAEVCVIGVPDAYRGQSPKAFIALKAGAPMLTLDDLKEFLKTRLGKHEMVHAMEIRASLPKTPVGKLSKKDLYEDEAKAG